MATQKIVSILKGETMCGDVFLFFHAFVSLGILGYFVFIVCYGRN